MSVITNIADLKRLHKKRTPKMFYDYCESGSWTEQTFRENVSDFEKIRLRQRIAVDMTNRTTASRMVGQDVAMPVALAPVGLTGMQRADGEIKAAIAAAKFGVPFPFHHVYLLYRRCCGAFRYAFLVSGLHAK